MCEKNAGRVLEERPWRNGASSVERRGTSDLLASCPRPRYDLRLMNPDVTQLLNALEQGDPHAAEELLPLVYQELRKLAAQRMAQEQPGQTLRPAALADLAFRCNGAKRDGIAFREDLVERSDEAI